MSEYKPYETFVEVIGDFQLHYGDDIYRFPIPKDITGQNIFKSTLLRIASYEALYPDKFKDIIAYTRGMAYERLGEYDNAMIYFMEASEYKSELAETAQDRMLTAKALDDVINKPLEEFSLQGHIRFFEEKDNKLKELITQYKGTPYEFVLLMAAEQNGMEYFNFLKLNRYLMDGGVELALEQIKQLIEENEESKNINKHKITLGDLYFDLAKEYALFNNPEQTAFDYDTFFKFVTTAKNIYDSIAYIDGIPEKLEARGKSLAVEAYEREIRALYQ